MRMNLSKFFSSFFERQLLVFLCVGLITMAVQVMFFSLFLGPLSLSPGIAVSLSYVLATAFHFFMNRAFTFKAQRDQVIAHLGKYIVVTGINYVNTIVVFDVIVRVFSLSPYLGLFASIGATVVTGFVLMKFWVFRDSSPAQRKDV
jgi:putative flippase GtrA